MDGHPAVYALLSGLLDLIRGGHYVADTVPPPSRGEAEA